MALIRVERPHDAVALLTLDRPDKRNALSTALRDEVSDALARDVLLRTKATFVRRARVAHGSTPDL